LKTGGQADPAVCRERRAVVVLLFRPAYRLSELQRHIAELAAGEGNREALKVTPDVARMHYSLSLTLDRLGDMRKEECELEQGDDFDPDPVVARNQLGILYMAERASRG